MSMPAADGIHTRKLSHVAKTPKVLIEKRVVACDAAAALIKISTHVVISALVGNFRSHSDWLRQSTPRSKYHVIR